MEQSAYMWTGLSVSLLSRHLTQEIESFINNNNNNNTLCIYSLRCSTALEQGCGKEALSGSANVLTLDSNLPGVHICMLPHYMKCCQPS